jgi:hypothetical protein
MELLFTTYVACEKVHQWDLLTDSQCADITFAEPEDVPEVNSTNCFNSTTIGETIGFQMVYTTTSSPAPRTVVLNSWVSLSVPIILAAASWMAWL